MTKQELCNNFYDMNNVVTVRITMPQNDWNALKNAEPTGGRCNFGYTGERYQWYQTTSIEISGSAFPVGPHNFASSFAPEISKKSFCGSWSDSKPALKLKFSGPGENAIESLIGTKFITLNNCIQDYSYIRQPLGYFLFKQAGLPYSRCNFAKVYVNGTYYGVYLNIEPIKKRHVQNNFSGNDKGNLYELEHGEDFTPPIMAADRISFEGFSDFRDKSDLKLATQEMTNHGLAGMLKVIDTSQFLRYFAMEFLLKHWDGYAEKTNNTYIYNDVVPVASPTVANVNFKFIPWGLDQIFQGNNAFQLYNSSVLSRLVFNDKVSKDKLKTEIKNYITIIFNQKNCDNVLIPYIDQMQQILASIGLPLPQLGWEINAVKQELKRVESGVLQLIGHNSWTRPAQVLIRSCQVRMHWLSPIHPQWP